MDDARVKEMLDALRAETTRRLGERGQAGDSAEVQRLSANYTSLDVLENRFGVSDGGGA